MLLLLERITFSFCGAVLLLPVAVRADEAPIEGFSNYYKREGVFDWAKNCRLVADLPPPGISLPASVRLRFAFDHDQERLTVFNYYAAWTRFDLSLYTSAAPFTYNQT